ncbi:MAG: radical SAM protein [bacterium]|nr:radical SAM protein [bacterium]
MYLKIMGEEPKEIFKNYESPFYVYLSLTNLCNANCSFCDVRLNKEKTNILNVKSIINELSQLGTKYIHFTGGGEPFINDDIFDYLEFCTKKNIKIVLISNGLNLNEEKIKKLSKYNIVNFFFSIDSNNAEIHNELRRTKNLWEFATKNINLIKKYMPHVNIILNHVINTKNIDDFSDFIKMKEYVFFDYINPIVIKDCIELFPNDEQIDNYSRNIQYYYNLAEKLNVKFLCHNIDFFSKKVESNGDRIYNGDLKCVYPSFCAFIDCPTGNVYPCDCSIHRDRDIYKIGNLIDNSFTEIWNGIKRKELKDKLINGKLNCKLKCDESNCLFNDKYFEREE